MGSPAPALCLGRHCKLHPTVASPAVAVGRIGRGSKGLMKTDWQRLGMLVLRRLSATAAQRAALICLPTAKVPKEALPAAPLLITDIKANAN